MRVLVFISVLLLCGCCKPQQKEEPPVVIQPCILDEALQRSEFADAINQAERDLPDDRWRDKPWRMNDSRDRREFAVATNILATVEGRLSQMTATELIHALKLDTHPGVISFGGVASYVFEIGNAKIIKQIQTRPKTELSILPSLDNDRVEVYEGPQGPGDSLKEVIHFRILNDTNSL